MRNLPPMNIRYPFDPTGNSPDNLVRDELRQLPLINKRILVPAMGAFYAESLRIRNLERDFVKGKDYELVMLYHDATVETGKDVNIGIYFSNLDIIGEVYLTYQVVGGQFTGVWEAVQQYVNVLLVDPRQVRWDDVLGKPDFYVPKEHFHDINDVYGLNALIPFLEEIRDAIMRIRSKELRKLYARLFGLENMLNDQINGSNEKIAKAINDLLKDNDDIRLLKERLKEYLARLEALENNNDLADEIARLKEFDRLISNKAASLEDTKAEKTALAETDRNVANLGETKADKTALAAAVKEVEKLNKTKADKSALDNATREIDNLKESKLDKTDLQPIAADVQYLKDNPGMTCESIGRLPQKPWVRGTAILAKGPDGNCFRLVPPESLFQDVGVKITADRTVIIRERTDTSQYYTVKYIVTNSGLNKNDKTQLTITLPVQNAKTPYRISAIEYSYQNADRIVDLGGNIYEIYGLKSGGTATFIFRLTPEGFGSYQLGAQVDVFSEYDTNSQNNTSTIILSSSLPASTIDENYIPSVDCPRIIGHDLTGNKPLKPLLTTLYTDNNRVTRSYVEMFSFGNLLPEYYRDESNKEPIKLSNHNVQEQYRRLNTNFNFVSPSSDGKIKLRLQNASSIIITKHRYYYSISTYDGLYKPVGSDNYYAINSVSNHHKQNDNGYNYTNGSMPPLMETDRIAVNNGGSWYNTNGVYVGFDAKLDSKSFADFDFNPKTSLLTINTDNGLFCITCRPAGNNCNWQSFIVTAGVRRSNERTFTYRIKPSGLERNLYTITTSEENSINPIELVDSNGEVIAHVLSGGRAIEYRKSDRGEYHNDYLKANDKHISEHIEINIPRGTVKKFKLYMVRIGNIPVIKGNLNISYRSLNRSGNDAAYYSNPDYANIYTKPDDASNNWSMYEVSIDIKSTATSTDNFDNGYIKINIV